MKHIKTISKYVTSTVKHYQINSARIKTKQNIELFQGNYRFNYSLIFHKQIENHLSVMYTSNESEENSIQNIKSDHINHTHH